MVEKYRNRTAGMRRVAVRTVCLQPRPRRGILTERIAAHPRLLQKRRVDQSALDQRIHLRLSRRAQLHRREGERAGGPRIVATQTFGATLEAPRVLARLSHPVSIGGNLEGHLGAVRRYEVR